MKTENKIVKLFIEEKEPKTIREIAQRIGADYKITHIATQRLLGKRILLSKVVGKSVLCELDCSCFCFEIYRAENERREELLRNSDVKQVFKEVMSKVRSNFFIFLIFGSYAKKRQIKSSDLDIMFVSNENGFEKRVDELMSLLPIKTHALVFSEKEFVRMKDSKKSNVVKEAIENNVLLYGIENYYRLKNA